MGGTEDESLPRCEGVVVRIIGPGCFLRANSQPANCPDDELFFIAWSRLRAKEDKKRISLGASVSFARISVKNPKLPNPWADDLVVANTESNPLPWHTATSPTTNTELNSVPAGMASIPHTRRHGSLPSSHSSALPAASTAPAASVSAPFVTAAPHAAHATSSTLVTSPAGCRTACEFLRACQPLALDCEGFECTPGVAVSLVQLAGRSAGGGLRTFLFDTQACPALFDHGLRSLLEAPEVVKAVHDCRQDARALHEGGGVRLAGVLDTQLAHALIHPGATRQISLARMIEDVLQKTHPLKDCAPHLTDRAFWGRRPISPIGIAYASADVELLLEAAIQLVRNHAYLAGTIRRQTLARITHVLQLSKSSTSSVPPTAFVDAFLQPQREEVHAVELLVDAELDALFGALPPAVCEVVKTTLPEAAEYLVDIVMDLHRPLGLFHSAGPSIHVPALVVTADDLAYVLARCGTVTSSRRACVGDSLHRCSVIANPHTGDTVGLTLRLSRSVHGLSRSIASLLVPGGSSVLVVGPPGRGKTTLLRDIARLLADEHDRRVVIVDTTNEIGGEGAVVHRALGRARRMMVPQRSQQHAYMLEAVQNHTPDVLVIDEIGDAREAAAAASIQKRGVQLVATAHGRSLADVIHNHDLHVLLGGVNTVILSASERQAESAVAKTRQERQEPPAFSVCIELLSKTLWRVHRRVADVVDMVLRGSGEVECTMHELDQKVGTVRMFTSEVSFMDESTIDGMAPFGDAMPGADVQTL